MSNYLRDERLRHKTKRQEKFEDIVGYTSIIGGLALAATAGSLELSGIWKLPSGSGHNKLPLEKSGDHHGSTQMPSEWHLKQFAHEHGVTLNQK